MKSRQVRRGDGYITLRRNKDGSISAQARWRDGKQWPAKTFREPLPMDASSEDVEAAEQVVTELAEDHLRSLGRSRRSGGYTPATTRVADLVTEYVERGRRNGSGRWSATTYAGYKQIAKAHIVPRIGSTRIGDLSPAKVQQWINDLEDAGLHPSTIHNCRIVLNGACKRAVVLGMIPSNPVTSTSVPKRERTNIKTWSPEHVAKVMDLVNDNVFMFAYYSVAITTGMRPGEIRALKWSDIDFESGVVHCLRTMTRDENNATIIGDVTKTKRSREIAVPENTMHALASLKSEQNARRLAAARWSGLDIVFDRGDGNPMYQKALAKKHIGVCALADVPEVRLHDLRHTAASLMIRNGVNLKIVSEILGHSSISTTADIYSHVDIKMQRTATDALGSLIPQRGKKRA